ncbi:MAG TPA: FHA domain-containing protein, partial [Gemmataceae bacterium]
MPAAPSAYLVARRDDGFGDVHALVPGVRYTLGRSPTNRIVLRDELCSREHAEIFADDGSWYLRDLGSLNGSKVNRQPIHTDRRLAPNDEVQLGRSRFLFVRKLDDLPAPPATPSEDQPVEEKLEIKKRLAQTRYLPRT